MLDWVTAVADNTARRDQAAFDAVSRHLSEDEVVELTVITAIRTMANRIQEALWTDLKGPEFPPNVRDHMANDTLVSHCETVLDHLRSATRHEPPGGQPTG